MSVDQRRLAAILFSDIVGYSSLSHRNEALALRLIKEHRELVRPLLAKFEGREVKTMGDGFLAEFNNAKGATLFAIELQQAHRSRNAEVEPDEHIRLRVGIHLGDVTALEGDVYGDGVNIAARLMQLAKPGRICVSSGVMDQARQTIPCWVSSLGVVKLKGISQDIRAFAICVEYSAGTPPPLKHKILGKIQRRPRSYAAGMALSLAVVLGALFLPSRSFAPAPTEAGNMRIAVLPLQGIGLGKEFDYLPDGITDEVISSLSELQSVRVLSKTSASLTRDKTPAEIGAALHVAEVAEGTVQKFQNMLRIHVRLIDTATQENIWSKEFEEEISNTFALQKKVAQQISSRVTSRSPASVAVDTPPSGKPEGMAYQHYLMALHLTETRTKDGIAKGLEQIEQSIKLDAAFAPALAAAAHTYLLLNFYGYMSPADATKKGEAYATRALEIDSKNADALLWFAERNAYESRDWVKADSFYRRAIESNPNSSLAYQWYGKFLSYMERFPEAKAAFEKGLELDPLSQTAITAGSSVDFYQGHYPETVRAANSAIDIDPAAMLPYFWKGKALLMQKDYAGALEAFRETRTRTGDSLFVDGFEAMALAHSGQREAAEQRMKKMVEQQQRGFVSHYVKARMFHALGQSSKAIEELSLSAADKESQAVSLKVDPFFEGLHSEPGFKALLMKLGFRI
ncbi:MAG: adenylate/guanylate cyclase domain-containing protein [Bdellovibrionota bacterium]